MTCNCVKEVNSKLAAHNTRLTQAIMFGHHDHDCLMLETEQVEKGRGKPKAKAMFLTFCPFCGTKYSPEGGAA